MVRPMISSRVVEIECNLVRLNHYKTTSKKERANKLAKEFCERPMEDFDNRTKRERFRFHVEIPYESAVEIIKIWPCVYTDNCARPMEPFAGVYKNCSSFGKDFIFWHGAEGC